MKPTHVFFSAPHRVMFFAGALQSLLPVLWWAFDLAGRFAGLVSPVNWVLPAIWLHSGLMVYGFFSFFIFGFLMTALPKWVAAGPLTLQQYLPAFVLMLGGWLLFWLGLLFASLPLLCFGLMLAVLGWGWGWRALFLAVRHSIQHDRQHAWAILFVLGFGCLGLLLYLAGVWFDQAHWVETATEVGVWGFLAPVFFIVTHRMLPFFSGNVIRGYPMFHSMASLWFLLGCMGLHALAAAFEFTAWLWLPDLLAAGVVFWLAWRWQLQRAFVSHLLAMHHSAGLWLGVAFLLHSIQEFVSWQGGSWGGHAPLHALSIGYFASVLIGMATRVSLGHSGRLISSDVWAWRLFWLLQVVVLLRLASEFVLIGGAGNLAWLAALGWLLVFGGWCAVHLPMYLAPRPDGRPG